MALIEQNTHKAIEKLFFFGRQPHSFCAFLDSSYSVLDVYEKEMKNIENCGFYTWSKLHLVKKMALIEQNIHKAIEKLFFVGRRPHSFLAFIDSSYSVSNVYEKEMKKIENCGFYTWSKLDLVKKMALIEQNTHKAIQKLFFLGDDPTFFWHL